MKRPECSVEGCKQRAVSHVVRRCERHEYEAEMARQAVEPERGKVIPLRRSTRKAAT